MNGAELSVVGTLGRDPELRYTPGGRAVANTSVAVSRRWQKNGEWQEQTTWFNLVIWAEMGENAAASLTKGTRVFVSGRLEERKWETPEGQERRTMELMVDEIGPSLRWATAIVEKNEREKSDGSSGYQAASSGGGSSAGGDSYRDTLSRDPIYGDEEPF